jgi:signal transduction histidine kinase
VTGSDDGRREVRPLFEAMFETRFMLDLAEDTDAVFRRFTDVLVPAFADFVAVFLLDDDGTHVDLVVHAHRDPMAAEHLEVIRRLSTTDPTLPEARVAASGEPFVAFSIGPDDLARDLAPELLGYLDAAAPESMLVKPLLADGRSFGSLVLARSSDSAPFTLDDVWFGESLAGRCAVVLQVKQMRAALRDALEASERDRAILGAVVDAAPFGLTLLDTDFRYVLANEMAGEIDGVPPEAMIGRTRAEMIGRRRHADTVEALRTVLETGEPLTIDVPAALTLDTEKARDYEVTYFAVDGPDGERLGLAVMLVDRTQAHLAERAREQLLQQIAQTQRLETVGQLAGAVAHDFNNLLSVISLRGELLRRKHSSDVELGESLAVVERAVEQGRELARRLLAFSRRQPVEAIVVEPAAIIAGFAGLLRATVGPTVSGEGDLADGAVLFDPGALEQVLLNLVVNAREAMPEGGTLRIGVTVVGRQLEMAVADDGEGMSDDVREHAFDPFFTTRGAGIGTGLGLSSVFGLVTGAGGTVHIDSAPGVGTTVTVSLPLVEPQESVAVITRSARSRAATLLVVDDEEDLLDGVVEALSGAGYRVLSAVSAEEALEQVAALAEIDMVISDVLLPGSSGATLVRRLQEIRPGLPALFISGFAPSADGDDALPEGVPLLRKPFSVDDLVRSVAAGLGDRG